MTPQQHIKNIYGFDFPEDFFLFHEFAQRLAIHPDLQGRFNKGLGLLDIYLGSVFSVFNADFDPSKKDLIETGRHYNDPPEFFTVLGGNTDGLHWGYYVDIPLEQPPVFWIASYYSRDAFQISANNRTLFQEARDQLERFYDGCFYTLKTEKDEEEIAYSKARIRYFDIIRPILMEYETAEREEIGAAYESAHYANFPKRITIADTRCGMGIVAQNRLYRPLRGVDKFDIWNYYPDEITVHQLHEKAIKAITDGFPATALKIGKDLWIYNTYNRITHEILYAAYGAMNRPILQKVMKKYVMAKNLLDDPIFKTALQNPDNQTKLNLNWKKISDLPTEIGQLKNLKKLDLSGNELDYLPDEIGQLTQLETLILIGNNFNIVPQIIGKLKELKVLKLSNNDIAELPDELGHLKKLEELHLFSTRLREFPKVIGQFKNLKKLMITRSKFSSISEELNKLTQLEELEIRADQPILNFPKSLAQLKNLKKLKFYSYYDKNPPPFPSVFCELENLEELEIARFIEYPTALEKLQKLTFLKIGNYQMTAFPKSIFKLKNLKKLHASSARLTEFPNEISALKALEDIYLYGNKIKKIPNSIIELPNLKLLNLGANELPKSEVERLKNLLPHVKLVLNNQK